MLKLKAKKKSIEQPEETDLQDQEENLDEQPSEDLDNDSESPEEEEEASEESDESEEEESAEESDKGEESQDEPPSFTSEEELAQLPPAAKKAAIAANKRMQAAFNRKMTELNNQYKGKKTIKSFDDLLQDQEFITWADKILAQRGNNAQDVTQLDMDSAVAIWDQVPDSQKRAYYTKLTPTDRQIFTLKYQVASMAKHSFNLREQDDVKKAVEEFGEVFRTRSSEVQKLRTSIQRNPLISSADAFKILDYKDFGKRMYTAGLQKGEKNLKIKTNSSIRNPSAHGTNINKKKFKNIREAMEAAEDEVGTES